MCLNLGKNYNGQIFNLKKKLFYRGRMTKGRIIKKIKIISLIAHNLTMKKEKIQFNEKKLVIAEKESKVEEMNQFTFETKIRKMVLDLVQPYIIDSTKAMVETKNEQNSLFTRVNLLEKRLNKLK